MIENYLKNLKQLGWTQEAIARKVGIPQSMISRLMRGKPCFLETAIKIADAFEVTLDEVADRSIKRKDKPLEKFNSASHAGSTDNVPCTR